MPRVQIFTDNGKGGIGTIGMSSVLQMIETYLNDDGVGFIVLRKFNDSKKGKTGKAGTSKRSD